MARTIDKFYNISGWSLTKPKYAQVNKNITTKVVTLIPLERKDCLLVLISPILSYLKFLISKI
jgi:hypothetical protein